MNTYLIMLVVKLLNKSITDMGGGVGIGGDNHLVMSYGRNYGFLCHHLIINLLH